MKKARCRPGVLRGTGAVLFVPCKLACHGATCTASCMHCFVLQGQIQSDALLAFRADGGVVWSTDGAPLAHPVSCLL